MFTIVTVGIIQINDRIIYNIASERNVLTGDIQKTVADDIDDTAEYVLVSGDLKLTIAADSNLVVNGRQLFGSGDIQQHLTAADIQLTAFEHGICCNQSQISVIADTDISEQYDTGAESDVDFVVNIFSILSVVGNGQPACQ